MICDPTTELHQASLLGVNRDLGRSPNSRRSPGQQTFLGVYSRRWVSFPTSRDCRSLACDQCSEWPARPYPETVLQFSLFMRLVGRPQNRNIRKNPCQFGNRQNAGTPGSQTELIYRRNEFSSILLEPSQVSICLCLYARPAQDSRSVDQGERIPGRGTASSANLSANLESLGLSFTSRSESSANQKDQRDGHNS